MYNSIHLCHCRFSLPKFKELLIQGPKHLLEEFIPQRGIPRFSTTAWKILPTASYLLWKINSSLQKGLEALPQGRSPSEKGGQSHPRLQTLGNATM